MSSSPCMDLPKADNDIPASESTPLLPHSVQGPRRTRSCANTIHVLPRRRFRTKPRLLKSVDSRSLYTDSSSSNPSSVDLNATDAEDARPPPPVTQSSPAPIKAGHSWLLSNISLTLDNSGSVARDHLASERTFLAYMRTSLAIASSGVAIVQLFMVAAASHTKHKYHPYIRPLGATTVVMGIIVLIIGVTRYFQIQAALTKGYFPVARITMGAIAMSLIVLVTLTFGLLVSGNLSLKGEL